MGRIFQLPRETGLPPLDHRHSTILRSPRSHISQLLPLARNLGFVHDTEIRSTWLASSPLHIGEERQHSPSKKDGSPRYGVLHSLPQEVITKNRHVGSRDDCQFHGVIVGGE